MQKQRIVLVLLYGNKFEKGINAAKPLPKETATKTIAAPSKTVAAIYLRQPEVGEHIYWRVHHSEAERQSSDLPRHQ
ncbi:hypothetical protein PG301_20650 [Parageobacillus sp. G301]|nr:hypothetical protein PG301_20650 [Parageobacillus sp. G301]